MRMHEVLEKREAIVNTLQTNFPCAETEHKNAPLYVQVSAPPAAQPARMHAAAAVIALPSAGFRACVWRRRIA